MNFIFVKIDGLDCLLNTEVYGVTEFYVLNNKDEPVEIEYPNENDFYQHAHWKVLPGYRLIVVWKYSKKADFYMIKKFMGEIRASYYNSIQLTDNLEYARAI